MRRDGKEKGQKVAVVDLPRLAVLFLFLNRSSKGKVN